MLIEHIDYLAMGEENFRQFIAAVRTELMKPRKHFDLIVGVGDSGQVMVALTKLIAAQLNISLPPIVLLPVYRFEGPEETTPFDNSVLLPSITQHLSEISSLSSVLFVDDEIYRGISLRTAIALLQQATGKNIGMVTVIAEDQGFVWQQEIPAIQVVFHPFSREKDGHNNVICYTIPPEFDTPIVSAFPKEKLPWKLHINLLLGLPTKSLIDGIPVYTDKHLKEAERLIPDFHSLQQQYTHYLEKIIEQEIQ